VNYSDEEIWCDIAHYEGLYMVSSHGRVRNQKGKIRKAKLTSSGYFRIGLTEDGVQSDYYVHILVADAFLPPRLPEHTETNHIDGIRTNNHYLNLERCTRPENIARARQDGTSKFVYTPSEDVGAKHKLTEDDVRAIRARYKPGLTSALAREYKVTFTTIKQIVDRKIWRTVE
jgi:hypothetical protein